MDKPRRALTKDDSDKFLLRLPDGMRERIADAARAENRTMNAEVVQRLQASFDGSDADLVAVAARLERSLARAEADALVAWSYERLVAAPFIALASTLPPDARMPGDPEGMSVGDWVKTVRDRLDDLEALRARESAVIEKLIAIERKVQPVEVALPPVSITTNGDGDLTVAGDLDLLIDYLVSKRFVWFKVTPRAVIIPQAEAKKARALLTGASLPGGQESGAASPTPRAKKSAEKVAPKPSPTPSTAKRLQRTRPTK